MYMYMCWLLGALLVGVQYKACRFGIRADNFKHLAFIGTYSLSPIMVKIRLLITIQWIVDLTNCPCGNQKVVCCCESICTISPSGIRSIDGRKRDPKYYFVVHLTFIKEWSSYYRKQKTLFYSGG